MNSHANQLEQLFTSHSLTHAQVKLFLGIQVNQLLFGITRRSKNIYLFPDNSGFVFEKSTYHVKQNIPRRS